jgi:hypothetical protein
MVGYFLVVQVPHARDKWRMAVLSGPVDRLFLRFEGAERVVGVILDTKSSMELPSERPLGRAST